MFRWICESGNSIVVVCDAGRACHGVDGFFVLLLREYWIVQLVSPSFGRDPCSLGFKLSIKVRMRSLMSCLSQGQDQISVSISCVALES